MKLTRDQLMDIFTTVCADEVRKYGEAMQLSAIEEFAILMLMSKVLDRIEEAIFK